MTTEAAYKAAMQILHGGKIFDLSKPDRLPTAESVAEIIDQETGLPELLAACLEHLEDYKGCDTDRFTSQETGKMNRLRAAIAKAKGTA